MTAEALTIAETAASIQAALRDYIEATYHVGHPTVIEQRRELLNREGVLFRAPFIESTPRYQTDRGFGDLDLDVAAKALFASLTAQTDAHQPLLYDPPYTHQAEALESTMRDGLSLAVTTGTGSGKTETFLEPMLAKLAAEAAHKPESFAAPAVRALILYPMNALVNDQLGRLRLLLGDTRVTGQFTAWAGRPVRFARYTSRTLYPGVRQVARDQARLSSVEDFYIDLLDRAANPSAQGHSDALALIEKLQARGKWPAKPDLKAWYGARGSRWKNKDGAFIRAVLRPEDPELLTRHEVLNTPPDVLITNYSMLEYMLMRPLERPIFDATRTWLEDSPDEKFLLVVDEAHLYRGAGGAEVALLLRRLRARLGITPDRLQVICTSASFASAEYARQFAAQLSGKAAAEFKTVEGRLALRESVGTGDIQDAQVLAAVPMHEFYSAEADAGRIAAVHGLLDYRGVTEELGATSGQLLHEALNGFGPLNLLVNETMQRAYPVDELGTLIFPEVKKELADRAASTLVALGSAARRSTDDAGLLPCRVHAFYRGLAGLWACLDPGCPEVDREAHPEPGPVGKLYAQPQAACGCGARVFELYTCRHCGSAYARAYADDVVDPSHLWHEPGGAFQSATGSIPELQAIDLLLEPPSADSAKVEPADLDLVTGRLNPEKLGDRTRGVFIPRLRGGESIGGEDDGEEAEANGEFKPCGVCGRLAGFGRSSVQDHQTKGDQPFQALVTRQVEVQPPGAQPYSDFAPLRGRKVLAFSDSRQVAARLAPNLQSYSLRDVMRPLILRGWRELADHQILGPILSLERLFVAVMVGAHVLSVRLRPELRSSESLHVMRTVAQAIDRGVLAGNHGEVGALFTTAQPPQSLLRAMYATLTDKHLGLASLGLASFRERANLTDELLTKLPDIESVAEGAEAKLALVRVWLAAWSTPGIWFPSMTDGDWWKQRGGVQPHAGKFDSVDRWLGSRAAKKKFREDWLQTLLTTLGEPVANGTYRLSASNVALDIGGQWGYCERCRFTQRPFPGSHKCVNCGVDRVRTLDPDTDQVFQARKGYYRASAVGALKNPPELPMSIIAAEHTAQLNAAQSDAVFSKAEEHELLFQDVDLGLSGNGEQPRAAIDVLSCTTTMEVGIDIGNLTGVALRNMPPSRANYQQRAGRAGRRGNAVATVLAFGGADTHDDHYFRQPELMIRGKVDDPVLTLDNEVIVRRHVIAYLLQRYHQERLPAIQPEDQPQLFEVLGKVTDFTGTTSPLNRTDLEEWLTSEQDALREEVAAWLPDELSADARTAVLQSIVTRTIFEIDRALDLDGIPTEANAEEASPSAGPDAGDSVEDSADEPSARRSQKNLLDRLLYKGVLPRYAFPTDVVAFHVFDVNGSTRFNTEFQYAASQGLTVALSQYAPGKVVWIDNKEWTSGAIYSPVQKERFQAWQERLLYFECQVCHYAKHFPLDEAKRGDERDCPACGAEGKFGKAKTWMRPPGFAHPAEQDPGTSPDDAPVRSYATRAKLMAPGPTDETAWKRVTDRLAQTYRRETLLVTNTGPRDEGYTYCTRCGLIEPTAMATGRLLDTHKKPYPDEKAPECPGTGSTRGLVLGTDFISDVLLVRLKVDSPITLRPANLSTHIALRSVAEALTIAATRRLGIETTELQAEYRPALTALGSEGLEAEIYVYDTLAGGAGFTRRVNEYGLEILERTLELLEDCPEGCDQSCYRCLRSFRNRFEHSDLDRHVGASLLRYLIHGTEPTLSEERLERSADTLCEDLRSRGGDTRFMRGEKVEVKGVGTVTAPILARRGRQEWIFGVHDPLSPDVAPTDELRRAKESGRVPVHLIDDMVISRNLPFASGQVLQTII